MGTTIVLDPGSTHAGRKELCKELIDNCREIKCKYLKFQLFPNTKEYTASGNVYLNPDWFGDLVKYGWKKGVQVCASVFDVPSLELVMRHEVPFVKFAYSQQDKLDNIKGLVAQGKKVVVSSDIMNHHKLPDGVTKLFCQPVYPTMWQTNFDNIFKPSGPFDGFSDHSLGISESIAAIERGATWIEKHVTLPYNESKATPDGRFGITFEEADELLRHATKENVLATMRTESGVINRIVNESANERITDRR